MRTFSGADFLSRRLETWQGTLPDHAASAPTANRQSCVEPALHRDSLVTAVMAGENGVLEVAERCEQQEGNDCDGGAWRLSQSAGFTNCTGALFLGSCCFMRPSPFVIDFLQLEIVLKRIRPCNFHELPNRQFRLGNLSRLL